MPAYTEATSQCAAILRHLQRHRGEWVPLPDLHAISGALAVPTRVSNLRQAGHQIVNRVENRGVEKLSFYQLQ